MLILCIVGMHQCNEQLSTNCQWNVPRGVEVFWIFPWQFCMWRRQIFGSLHLRFSPWHHSGIPHTGSSRPILDTIDIVFFILSLRPLLFNSFVHDLSFEFQTSKESTMTIRTLAQRNYHGTSVLYWIRCHYLGSGPFIKINLESMNDFGDKIIWILLLRTCKTNLEELPMVWESYRSPPLTPFFRDYSVIIHNRFWENRIFVYKNISLHNLKKKNLTQTKSTYAVWFIGPHWVWPANI